MSDNNKEKPSSRQRLLETGQELKKALEVWDQLALQEEGLSTDEQLLKDVQVLLKELKSQLEEFNK